MKTIKSSHRDWKQSEDYKDMENLDSDQWAWEFLKRNPAYIKEWNRLTEGWTEEEKELKRIYLLAPEWGLKTYLNPDAKHFYHNIRFIPYGGEEEIISSLNFKDTKGTVFLASNLEITGEVLYRFNTRHPIKPQIDLAKKNLLALQQKQKGGEKRKAFKPRRDEWILLIRILDATAAGAKDKVIASILFPDANTTEGIKRVYDKGEQAMRYVERDYRLIPYSEK